MDGTICMYQYGNNVGILIDEGVIQEESIIYLDPTGSGKRRYITGLNEFAPEVQMLSVDE